MTNLLYKTTAFTNLTTFYFKADEAPEAGEEIETTVTGTGSVILSLKLLPMTKMLHAKHGLRHGDYQRYRGYCARRLARLRKVLKMVQGELMP